MSERYEVSELPEVDQRMIKRGMCPWCVTSIVPIDDGAVFGGYDQCSQCGDSFVGTLTIED